MFAQTVRVMLAAVVVLALAMPVLAGETFIGEVQAVTVDGITVMVGTEHLMFRVANDAKITLDGAAATLQDLKPGHIVTLSAERSDDVRWLAVEVAATTAQAAPSAAR
jgi:hypothetical protein